MAIKITTLVENTVAASLAPLMGEHGLAFLVETPEKTILFDAGQGGALKHNAPLLGVDLSRVDTVVLSHGHYDHARGLVPLTEQNTNFDLIVHEAAFANKQVCLGEDCFPIGMPQTASELSRKGINVRTASAPVEIAPGVTTTGEIPMETDFESIEPMFFTDVAGTRHPDSLPDDNALFIDTDNGTVVVFGCAHRGAVNTLKHVVKLTGRQKIHAILGGLHLFLADNGKLEKVAEELAAFDIDRIIVGHCTGFPAMAALYNRFGSKVTPNAVGLSFTF